MRVATYVRVSSEEQIDGYSLEAQRQAIRRECEAHGYEIAASFADEGRSAKHDTLERRPGFRAAVAAVAAGDAEALIVHKLDRAARNLAVLLEVLRQIDGRLISVVERTDYSTPQGKFFVHMLGVLAQFYSDNLSQEVKKGKGQRQREGLYNGRLPFGTTRDPRSDDGKLPPVRDDTPVLCTIADRRTWSRYEALQYLFERAAAGASCPQLVHELGDIGFHLGLGTVWEILNNRFYLGELPVGDPAQHHRRAWLPGAHQAFIGGDLFERAAAARARNKSGAAAIRRHAQVYPLTGLGRCARCGGPMHCRRHGKRSTPAVFCANRASRRTCDQPGTIAAPIEEQCLEYVRRIQPPPELAAWVAEQVVGARPDTRREPQSLQRQMRRLQDLYRWGDIEQHTYLTEKRDLERRVAAACPAPTAGADVDAIVAYLRDLHALYEHAEPAERNDLLHQIFTRLEIDAGAVRRVALTPGIATMMDAWGSDAFRSSGRTESVCIAVRDDDGFFVVPPLEIMRRAHPKIPAEYWPQILTEYGRGVRAPALAAAWNVSEATIWRTLRRARHEEAQA